MQAPSRPWLVRAALSVALVAALTACGHSTRPAQRPPAPPLPLAFGYDQSAPLRYADHGVIARHGTVVVRDVSYSSGSSRVAAYLVEEPAAVRRPGVVLVHGSGGDRSELLADAVALARRGMVALTITEPSSAHPPPPPANATALLDESVAVTEEDVVAVRRAADVLDTLGSVDPQRLGYLGWSAGAKTGTFVAATDPRFAALALLSAGADTVSAFVAAAPVSIRKLARERLGSVDPLAYVAAAGRGKLLLEDGRSDEIVPRPALLNVIRAAPSGTVVRWYPTGHALDARAYRDAFSWLARRLRAG